MGRQRRGVEPYGMAQKALATAGNGKAMIRVGSAWHGSEMQRTAKEWLSAETICGAMEQQFRLLIGNGNELLCGVAQWKSNEVV